MATGKFALSTLHEISWPWQLEELHCPLCMKYLAIAMEGRHCRKCHVKWALQKNVMLSQQGVRFVISSRGKKCEVILSVFCLSSENYLCICVCICNLFLEGGTRSKKKFDILEKMEGGGKTKCGFNKRSITPPY